MLISDYRVSFNTTILIIYLFIFNILIIKLYKFLTKMYSKYDLKFSYSNFYKLYVLNNTL